jgi:glucose/arabinose dehydrogenase
MISTKLHLTILLLFSIGILNAQTIKLTPFATGFTKPLDISNTGNKGDTRLFITEKDGKIKIVQEDGTKFETPFLDIDSKVNSAANERGLLGLCFDPNYSNNGFFYVHYNNSGGHSTISRYKVSENNADVADPNSEKIIIVVNQPFNNHNAGDIEFGPDGYLYIGMGDGGNGGDPGNRSQNPKTLLGKMLRLDVNTETSPYIIPADNPYVNSTDTLPEIWAMGLRNPWRFSIDTVENNIWIADVGQDQWEEVNVESISKGAINYGWRCYEGNTKFNFSECNENTKYNAPVAVYLNAFDIGCSITGGYVYRGNKYPSLYGKYLYTDFCTGVFRVIYWDNALAAYVNKDVADLDNQEFATFGLDINGEMYVAGLANGIVYRIESEPTSSANEFESIDQITFTISPNPAQNYIEVKFKNEVFKNSEWMLYSISDIPYATKVLNQNDKSVSIDIASLPVGVYILKSNKHAFTQKFIKH